MVRPEKLNSSKYPEWKKKIGQYRVDKMKNKYEMQGYKVTTFPIEKDGIDMVAENEEEIIL